MWLSVSKIKELGSRYCHIRAYVGINYAIEVHSGEVIRKILQGGGL